MGNDNAWILVVVAVVLGFSAGLVVARWVDSDTSPPVEATSADPRPTPPECLDVCGPQVRTAAEACQDTDAKLEQCHAALMASWANASHPIEVAELDSSFDAAKRFADAYYADDDPAELRRGLADPDTIARLEQLAGGHDMEMGDVFVSCDPLPCVMEFDLTYAGDGDPSREDLDSLFHEMKSPLTGVVTEELDGYHLVQNDFVWGQDPGQRTFHSVVTSHSQDEMDTLVESMILFAEEVLGNKRFE